MTGERKTRRWSRRGFLKVTAAGGGALAVAFVVGPVIERSRRRSAMRDHAETTGEFQPNAWLTIHSDETIVFKLDRVEMGQGTMTSHPMLIAEELEVDPTSIQVEFAVADSRYNHPEFGLQITGGSSSVRTSYGQLRRAGAVAREMLRAAGAETLGVPVEECVAEAGAIVHRPSGQRRTYGTLTVLAANQPIPEPALKPESDCTVIGTSLDRLDVPLKVDGTATFGIDTVVPGMLNAAIIRPPRLGATVTAFDGAAALARPGVRHVVDVPSGVAVVADRYWQARAALDDVVVEWAGGRGELSTATMSEELRRLTEAPGKSVRDDGDVETALAADGTIVEAVYEVPHLAHAPMESQNCTAHVEDDRCEIWAPTQSPGVARDLVATALDLPVEKVTVHTTFLGGGFGRRLVSDFVLEAALVSRRVGRPVKVVWSREDDMCHSLYRPQVCHAMRAVLDGSGTPVAWRHRVASPTLLGTVLPEWLPAITPGLIPNAIDRGLSRMAEGTFTGDWVADPTSTEGASDTPYAIENLRVEVALHDPGVPVGFWRSVGHSHTAFAVESFVDELAAAAGVDPYEFRRTLLRNAPRHLAVLDAAAEAAGWERPAPARVFRGIAQHFSFETYAAQVAEVSVDDGRIRVRRIVCAVDCGRVINPDIVRAQMESGIVFGLSAALKQRLSYVEGHVEQTNFHDFEMLRMNEMPEIEVVILDSEHEPTGVGEPGVPPIAPAPAAGSGPCRSKRSGRNASRCRAHDTSDRPRLATA